MINYSELRKDLQAKGEIPEWYTTGGTQLFYEKYSYNNETVRSRFTSVAKALAQHAPKVYPSWWESDSYTAGKTWEQVFFNTMWDGFISPSTPLLANGGIRKRGTTVSCAGGYVGNNLFDRYNAITEAAILTKHSHGTSYSIDHWPAEGEKLKRGGRSRGVLPIIRDFITAMEEVTQGSRRGSLAYSIRPQHGDFEKVLDYLYTNTESNNVGWLVDDNFVRDMDDEDPVTEQKFGKMLGVKMPRGKGYYTFISKMNRHLAEAFRRKGMTVKASNLCVAPETQILTDKGYFPIAELEGQKVVVWNGQEWSETKVVKTGSNQKLVQVITDFGHVIDCTEYHKFYVQNEYGGRIVEKRACELKAGDKLIKFDLPVIEGYKHLDKAYTNGFYTGDGCTIDGTRAMVYLYHAKRGLEKFIEHEGTWNHQEEYNRSIAFVKDLKHKFFVPDASYTIESRLQWLAGWMDADGTVSRNGANHSLQASSVEKNFLTEVQLMLQTLGVQSKIQVLAEEGYRSLPKNDGTGENAEYLCQKAYRLLITSNGLYKLACLGFKTNRLQWDKRLPQREAERFVTIKEVVDNGRFDDTYCFNEPKRHMGMFNGILTGQCQETCLPSDEDYTFSCVILNYNLELWDKWPEHLVFIGQVMADCNISEYLESMEEMTPMDRQAMQKIYRFTKEFRALGSGVLGWHTLMQSKKLSVSSLECSFLNKRIFKRLDDESLAATQWLAGVLGEPEGCVGLGIRNATRLMCPPTKSTAELMAGASEGIGLDTAMAFTKQSAGGEFFRVNKVLVKWIKEKGLDFDSCVREIVANKGSVQKVDWLDDEEKAAMRTGFEVPMEDYLRLCSQRQKYIDQAQSINLYFTSNDSEEYIGKIHKMAFKDEGILSLYYIYSMRGAGDISRVEMCEVCQ